MSFLTYEATFMGPCQTTGLSWGETYLLGLPKLSCSLPAACWLEKFCENKDGLFLREGDCWMGRLAALSGSACFCSLQLIFSS